MESVPAATWTEEERLALVRAYEEMQKVLKGSFDDGITATEKKEAWQRVAEAVNAVGGRGKTVRQCQKKWQNVSSRSKQLLNAKRVDERKTGMIYVLIIQTPWNCPMTTEKIVEDQ